MKGKLFIIYTRNQNFINKIKDIEADKEKIKNDMNTKDLEVQAKGETIIKKNDELHLISQEKERLNHLMEENEQIIR